MTSIEKHRSVVFDVICLSAFLCNVLIDACVEEPIVETTAGKVRGAKVTGSEGDVFCAFKGIPYAKTPVGELRFKDPEPVEPWPGIKEATSNAPMCAQFNYISQKTYFSEDCLYVYVYTKNIDAEARRPVMLWIHPGSFYWSTGDDSLHGPDYFMSKDIVLVTLNYRLNVFGFLNLEDEVAPGNAGLKDQLLALKWIRDNIARFGGDPDNVTIFGSSAGAASVHYIAMSPLTKGLYHKAIMQSGAAFNPWALQLNAKEGALQLSNYLGHTSEDPKSIVEFLRTIDAQTLLTAVLRMLTTERFIQLDWQFGPGIDSKSNEPFLPIHPDVAAADGIDVPLMIGHNDREGLLLYLGIKNACDRFDKGFRQHIHPVVEDMLKRYNLTFEDLRFMYFGNGSITNENIDEVVDMAGDLYFVEGIQRIVKSQIEKSSSPTYYYQYTYDKDVSLLKKAMQIAMRGASHTDETFSMFRSHFMEGKMDFPERGSEKYKIVEQLIELWVNFATTGNPTPKQTELLPVNWEPVKNETFFEYLNIGENLRMDNMPSLEKKYAMKFLK